MALPYSRPSNPTAGAEIPSADIAELMDANIAGAQNVSSHTFKPIPFGTVNFAASGIDGVGGSLVSSGVANAYVEVPRVCTKDRVLSFSVIAQGNGAANVVHNLYVSRDDGSLTLIATVTDNHRAAVWGSVSLVFGVPYTLLPGEVLIYVPGADAAGAKILKCTVGWDRPLP